jgi:hypothetical protein
LLLVPHICRPVLTAASLRVTLCRLPTHTPLSQAEELDFPPLLLEEDDEDEDEELELLDDELDFPPLLEDELELLDELDELEELELLLLELELELELLDELELLGAAATAVLT